jgi:hypothetical protein
MKTIHRTRESLQTRAAPAMRTEWTGNLRGGSERLGRRHVGDEQEWRLTVRSGTASSQIVKAAKEFGAGLVIMLTSGLSHAPPEELGSDDGARGATRSMPGARFAPHQGRPLQEDTRKF